MPTSKPRSRSCVPSSPRRRRHEHPDRISHLRRRRHRRRSLDEGLGVPRDPHNGFRNIVVVPGWLEITNVRNSGMAWSLFQGFGSPDLDRGARSADPRSRLDVEQIRGGRLLDQRRVRLRGFRRGRQSPRQHVRRSRSRARLHLGHPRHVEIPRVQHRGFVDHLRAPILVLGMAGESNATEKEAA
jgi:hypothetical protein